MICCKFSLHAMAFASEIETYFIMKKHVRKTQVLLPLKGMICKTVGGKEIKLIRFNLVDYIQNSVKKKVFYSNLEKPCVKGSYQKKGKDHLK